MKNLLLLLLLANVLFFVWQQYAKPTAEAGVVLVDQSTFGLASDVRTNRIAEPVASVGAVLGEGQIAEIAAAVGKACISIGPFDDFADAADARRSAEADGQQAVIREGVTQAFVGHWVQVRNVADVDTETAYLETLREARLGDAYAYAGDEGTNISIGVFGEQARAESVRQQVEELGLLADVSPRYRDVSVYFVDIGLPAGTAIQGLVRQFGSERVLQGDAASCPGTLR